MLNVRNTGEELGRLHLLRDLQLYPTVIATADMSDHFPVISWTPRLIRLEAFPEGSMSCSELSSADQGLGERFPRETIRGSPAFSNGRPCTEQIHDRIETGQSQPDDWQHSTLQCNS